MRRKDFLGGLPIGVLVVSPVAYVAASSTLASIGTTVTIEDPPLAISGVTFAGAPCSGSSGVYTCLGDVIEGASAEIAISLSDPASISQSAASTTIVPSGCSGVTATDSSVTVSAGSTATLYVTLSAATSATAGLICSISTTIGP